MRVLLSTVLAAFVVTSSDAYAQVRYIDGLFVATDRGPTELIAWAEPISRGQLRMTTGTLEDAPTVHEITRILCSLPLWKPAGILITTERIFREDRVEQRQLAFAVRKLNVYALELRVVDLERRAKIDSLLKTVRASHDAPGYAFVVLTSGDYRRYYPIRLTAGERQ